MAAGTSSSAAHSQSGGVPSASLAAAPKVVKRLVHRLVAVLHDQTPVLDADLPVGPKNGVPKPPSVQRSAIFPDAPRCRAGESTATVSRCSASRVSANPAGTGCNGL